jgi:hypothetical protein
MLRLRIRLLSAATALVLAVLLLTALSGVAQAETLFFANLTNDQESPPVVPTLSTGGARPASFGSATFVLNDAMTALTFSATIFNIDFTGMQSPDTNDNLTNAHIHAAPVITTTAPVVWGFIGAPFNDNNPNDVVVTPFATGVGGTVTGKWDLPEGQNTTLTAQLPNIFSGNSYINFHTVQFAGGETRGVILQVPEPSTISLLFVGTVGLLGTLRRLRV